MRIQRLSLAFLLTTAAHAMSAVTGLLIARWLSVSEYALYTILITVSGSISVLTKGGIGFALNAILGRVWPDKSKAKTALSLALAERRILSLAFLPIILISSAWLFYKNDAGAGMCVLLIMLIAAQWTADNHFSLFDQVVMFAGQQGRVQKLDFKVATVRLILLAIFNYLSVLGISMAALLNVLATAAKAPFVKRWAQHTLGKEAPHPDRESRREIREIALRHIPLGLLYCFQSQISLFIISGSMSVYATAAYGALGRIAQLLVPFTIIFNAYAIPRFAQEKDHVVRRFCELSLFALLPGLALAIASLFTPTLLLWLVGDKYLDLRLELFASAVAAGASLWLGSSWLLLANRGWTKYSLLQIPVFLLWCLISPLFLDFSKLTSVFIFQVGFPMSMALSSAFELVSRARDRRAEMDPA